MIEELRDYLVRQNYSEDLADEIHDAYYDDDIDGVLELARSKQQVENPFGVFEHDYAEEFVNDVRAWQWEVGEA